MWRPHKRSKYGAKKTVVDGVKFDSKKEAFRHSQLLLLEKAGHISDLELQKVYKLTVNDQLICKYIADFEYRDSISGEYITEDVKGGTATITPAFRIKMKLMKAIHGIEVRIV